MAEKPQKSGVEVIKENSRQLRGTIAEELAGENDHFSKEDVQLLKHHGTYQQDDRDARKKRATGATKSDREYIFMVRTRIPGGKLTAQQVLAELDIADQYANGTLRVTTRQGFQLHGVVKRNLAETIRRINEVQLTTLAACGDVERNVMCCPAPHRHDPIHEQLQAIADQIAEHLKPRTRAYYEIWLKDPDTGERQQVAGKPDDADIEPIYGKAYLPRKFKTGIGLPDDNCIDIHSQDIGLLAVIEDNRLLGFNVLVGGGMGTSPSDQDTFPALAQPMSFVEPDQVLPMVTAIVMVQRDFGNRADRKLARMKYLIHDWGLPRFRAKVEEYYGGKLADPHPTRVRRYEDHLGWQEQGDGRLYLGLPIENGRIQDEGTNRLKSGLRRVLERFGMPVRNTPQQNMLLCDIEPGWRGEIEAILQEYGVPTVERISTVRRNAFSCPALPTCGLAVTESERVLPGIIDELETRVAEMGLSAEHFSVRMTGCPNGCARPYIGDVGLVGRSADTPKKEATYTLFVAGNLVGDRLNVLYKDYVPRGQIVAELVPLLVYFKQERHAGESFGDFCHRKGVEDLRRFAERYQQQSNGSGAGSASAEAATSATS